MPLSMPSPKRSRTSNPRSAQITSQIRVMAANHENALVMFPVTWRILDEVHGWERTIWTVKVSAKFRDINQHTLELSSEDLNLQYALLKELNLLTEPPHFYHETIDKITLMIPEETPGKFPSSVTIEKDKQWSVGIDLNEELNNSVNGINWFEKIIKIEHPLIIQETNNKGNYSSNIGMDR
jgi:hypothetical protein